MTSRLEALQVWTSCQQTRRDGQPSKSVRQSRWTRLLTSSVLWLVVAVAKAQDNPSGNGTNGESPERSCVIVRVGVLV